MSSVTMCYAIKIINILACWSVTAIIQLWCGQCTYYTSVQCTYIVTWLLVKNKNLKVFYLTALFIERKFFQLLYIFLYTYCRLYNQLHALIIGPFDTPYEGGFFYFYIRCPPDYPIRPPRVRLMSTGGGRVRFNPNLYKNGKVCLSILG